MNRSDMKLVSEEIVVKRLVENGFKSYSECMKFKASEVEEAKVQAQAWAEDHNTIEVNMYKHTSTTEELEWQQ